MKNVLRTGLAAAALFLGSPAYAGVIGGADASDVTLANGAADYFLYLDGANTQGGGPNGGINSFKNDTGLNTYGSGTWTSLVKFVSNGGTGSGTTLGTANGLPDLTFWFHRDSVVNGEVKGQWSVVNNNATQNIALDLLFAMHGGGGSGVWLFDNQLIPAGGTLTGNWALQALNHVGGSSSYSNLTFFSREVGYTAGASSTTPSNIPEPGTLALLAAGAGLLGFMRRRRT